jgi:Fic family protein
MSAREHEVAAPLTIELSQAQIDQVVRHASGAGTMSALLSGLSNVSAAIEATPQRLQDGRMSQSLLLGLLLLAAFPADGSYLGNTEIARLLNLNTSTAHRYVSTLVAVGLLERHPTTRKYRLAHTLQAVHDRDTAAGP